MSGNVFPFGGISVPQKAALNKNETHLKNKTLLHQVISDLFNNRFWSSLVSMTQYNIVSRRRTKTKTFDRKYLNLETVVSLNFYQTVRCTAYADCRKFQQRTFLELHHLKRWNIIILYNIIILNNFLNPTNFYQILSTK